MKANHNAPNINAKTRGSAIAGSVFFSAMLLVMSLAVTPAVVALELKGDWQQGALIVGKVVPGAQVFFMDRPVHVSHKGDFVIGLGRDAPAEAVIKVRQGGQEKVEHFSVARREYSIQRVDGVPQKTVKPPVEVLQRIRNEAALVKAARADDSDTLDFLSGFQRPLEGPITGVYGSQRIYNGEPRSPHYGLDIAAPMGTLVKAPAPGVVKLVHNDMFYSGGTLIVDHGHGVSSTFIHLSEILVSPGDQVSAGDNIARVGATGRATGPHLDWRINWFDERIDPALVLEYFPAAE